VSPILVRPVREQLEHDRVIRLLQGKWRRRYTVAINPGNEQNASVGKGPASLYPDLVISSSERGKRLEIVVEVETAESVNRLEAMSQWAAFARHRAAFHLYVPGASLDAARRLCGEYHIAATEIWTYHLIGDQLRFTQVHKAPAPVPSKTRRPAVPANRNAAAPRSRKARPAAKAASRPRAKKVARKAPRTQKRK
jgi:hypothetical protein